MANIASPTETEGGLVGALLIEVSKTTPLGPRILSADEGACRITGYEMNSLLGSPIGLIYDNRDLPRLLARLPRVAQASGHFWMERNLIKNRGYRQRVRWTIRPHRKEDGEIGGFFLTIVPLKQEGEAKLEFVEEFRGGELPEDSPPSRILPANESGEGPGKGPAFGHDPAESEFAEESRSESLAMAAGGVAHDIKNNLHSIKANLDLAYKIAPHATDLLDHLEDAQMALEDAEMLARQMLAFTRGESSESRNFDVEPQLRRVAAICAAGSDIRTRFHISPKRLLVHGDPKAIYQVFHNLVKNACDAMPKGGVLDLSVGSRRWEKVPEGLDLPSGVYTVVSIRDRGCGIAKEILHRIFEKRFTTKVGGSGFGLAWCLATVKRHGGLITVESQVDVGSEFLVFLPATSVGVAPAGATGSPNAAGSKAKVAPGPVAADLSAPGAPPLQARVLVVEDQAPVAKATCGMLKHLGHSSRVAENGSEALRLYLRAKYSDEPFDLVLLDMTLPGGLSGGEVFHEMRRQDPGVRVVATSGYFDDESADILGNREFTGILPKPFSMEALDLVIRTALCESN